MNQKDRYTLIKQREATHRALHNFNQHRKSEWRLEGHDTGIHTLNMMIGGWIPQKLTTIAARSGVGKTAMTVPMFKAAGRALANRKAAFLFFTWEMSPEMITDRFVCHEMDFTMRRLKQGAKLMSGRELNKVNRVYQESESLPVVYQRIPLNLKETLKVYQKFVDGVHRLEDKEGMKIIPVFALDYIAMAELIGNRSQTYLIGEFMNGLKSAVTYHNGAGIVFGQLKRETDRKDEPEIADLSDSSFIENASDNVVLLHRPEHSRVDEIRDPVNGGYTDSHEKMLLKVMKSRDYGTGDALINCRVKSNRFWAREHDWEYPYYEDYQKEEFWLKHFKLG
jgi:replicative DNA helicase